MLRAPSREPPRWMLRRRSLVPRRAGEGEGREMERGHALTRGHEAELLAGHEQRQVLADAAHAAKGLVIRLREAEVLDRMDDLAVEDRERAVARHAGDDGPQLMHPPRVPEARDQNTLLHPGDELFARLVARLEAQVHRGGEADERQGMPGVDRLVPVRGDRVVYDRTRDAVLDEGHAVARPPFD